MSNLLGDQYRRTDIDQRSGAKIQLTNLHAHTHRGKTFSYNQSIAVIANSGYLYFEMITPSSDDIDLKNMYLWISEGPVLVDFLESPTLTTGVTAVTPCNRNRNLLSGAVIASGVTIKTNPTGISGGTSIIGDALRFGINGQGSQSRESSAQSQEEYVLRAGNITYLISLQNISGGNISASVNIIWYE